MADDDSKRFRARAQDCRRLAKDARDRRDGQVLADMATELDAEAEKIEREERGAKPNDA
jgi:hypothetical protein